MNKPINIPVIFLAFANEQVDDNHRLQALAREQDELEKALNVARRAGLCEVIVKPNASVDNIIETFQEYRDRICIFHFAGHADGYQLLLEGRDGENVIAQGEGLVDFFQSQKSLQLIFFNGCSTEKQTKELRDKGVPAVVGTSSSIPDDDAVIIARNFYRSIGGGASLDQAWQEAVSKFKMEGAGQRFRGIRLDHQSDGLPWAIYYNEQEEERIKQWSLNVAAQNPLFGLPLPDQYYHSHLPEHPFPGLHYFTQKDAAIFFGRGEQIQAVYQKLKGKLPVILLYGKSGVGKSSLLFAGLKPRIEDQYIVAYARRSPELGLTGTLGAALDRLFQAPEEGIPAFEDPFDEGTIRGKIPSAASLQDAIKSLQKTAKKHEGTSIGKDIHQLISQLELMLPAQSDLNSGLFEKWKTIESLSGKSLLVILDQVEEIYTRPVLGGIGGDAEFREFLKGLKGLYQPEIKGRLLLSFRKEYLPEIRSLFQEADLSFDELFLQRLNRAGIIEAITGVEKHPFLARYYVQKYQKGVAEENRSLRTEQPSEANGYTGLAGRIAEDLTKDPDSPIAPVLQIILSKLWKQELEQEAPDFELRIEEYGQLENTVGAFFHEQMERLQEYDLQEVARSGLALDVLLQHTTEQGTATSCSFTQLAARYPEQVSTIRDLLDVFQQLSLVVRLNATTTLLAHDVLAPVIIQAFNDSDKPGQRATRILNGKMRDVRFELNTDVLQQVGLPEPVREHLHRYLPHATLKDNSRFLRWARETLREIRADMERSKLGLDEHWTWDKWPQDLLIAAEAYIGESPFAEGMQGLLLNEREIEALKSGRSGMRKLTPREEILLDHSTRVVEQRRRALQNALDQANQQLSANFWEKARQARANGQNAVSLLWAAEAIEKNPDSRQAMNIALDFNELIPDYKLMQKLQKLRQGFFAPRGDRVLFRDGSEIHIVDATWTESISEESIFHKGEIDEHLFSPNGQYLISWDETSLNLWSLASGRRKGLAMEHENRIQGALFSPSGDRIISWDGVFIKQWSTSTTKEIGKPIEPEWLDGAVYAPDEELILSWGKDTAQQWSAVSGEKIGPVLQHKVIKRAMFAPNGDRFLTFSNSHGQLWSAIRGKRIVLALPEEVLFWEVTFSPDGSRILAWGDNFIQQCLSQTGKLTGKSMEHERVWGCRYSSEGKFILSWGENVVKIWLAEKQELIGKPLDHEGVDGACFSPDGKFVLSWGGRLIKCWSPETGIQLGDSIEHENLRGVQFSPDGRSILSWGDNNVFQWTVARNATPRKILHQGATGASLSPTGDRLLSWGEDLARVWSSNTNTLSCPSVDHENIKGALFHPNKDIFLTWNWDSMQLWSAKTGKPVGQQMQHESLRQVRFCLDGDRIYSLSWETARIWSSETGKQIGQTIDHDDHRGTPFAPDGKHLLSFYEGKIHQWSLITGKIVGPAIQPNGLVGAVYSPDGKYILSWDLKEANLWSLETGELVWWNRAFFQMNRALFSPKKGQILTVENDNLRLWSTTAIRELIWEPEEKIEEAEVLFDAQGDHLLSWVLDDLRVWSLATGELIVKPIHHEEITGADFSRDRQYIFSWSGSSACLWDAKNGLPLGPFITADAQFELTLSAFQSIQPPTSITDPQFQGPLCDGVRKRIIHGSRIWDVGSALPIGKMTGNRTIADIFEEGDRIDPDHPRPTDFNSGSCRVVTIENEEIIDILDLRQDLDFPIELFRLQAQVFTGLELLTDTKTFRTIGDEEWADLKLKYLTRVWEHYKTCQYKEVCIFHKLQTLYENEIKAGRLPKEIMADSH